MIRVFAASLLFMALGVSAQAQGIQNYVFFNLDREGAHQESFLTSPLFVGAQLKYTWRELEPQRGQYDFSLIEADVALLTARGKKLFLQLQDVSFSDSIVNVPEYVRTGSEFHGGADRQYEFANDSDAKPKPAGWVARRWDPAVAERFEKLLGALGKAFDGRVEGIALPETSVDFGTTGRYWPQGFTPASYPAVIIARMAAAKTAFPRSVVLQYTNFFPGEWLPWDDKGYQLSIWTYAAANGIALGGPDLIPYKKAQMAHSFHFAQQFKGRVVTGYAVQEGNYSQKNAQTGRAMTIKDIITFATDVLGAAYVFWYPESPWFERDVVPFLKASR